MNAEASCVKLFKAKFQLIRRPCFPFFRRHQSLFPAAFDAPERERGLHASSSFSRRLDPRAVHFGCWKYQPHRIVSYWTLRLSAEVFPDPPILREFEAHFLPAMPIGKARMLKRKKVDEDVRRSIIGSNEAVALILIEHSTVLIANVLSISSMALPQTGRRPRG
jgi:hypothetical protein